MTIIRINIDDDLLDEFEEVIEEHGFRGRSDAIRQAMKQFLQSIQKDNLSEERIEGVLTVIHREKTDKVRKITHQYSDVIKTQVHDHLETHDCLEVLILEGKGRRIKDLKKDIEVSFGVEMTNLLLS